MLDLQELDQELSIDAEKNEQRVKAHFDARRNQTIVVREEPEAKTKLTNSRLDLLRLATATGKLKLSFSGRELLLLVDRRIEREYLPRGAACVTLASDATNPSFGAVQARLSFV